MWQILQCRGRRLGYRLATKVSMPLRKRRLSLGSLGSTKGLWLAKLMTERKVHCVAFMKAAIPTSKLTRGWLHRLR